MPTSTAYIRDGTVSGYPAAADTDYSAVAPWGITFTSEPLTAAASIGKCTVTFTGKCEQRNPINATYGVVLTLTSISADGLTRTEIGSGGGDFTSSFATYTCTLGSDMFPVSVEKGGRLELLVETPRVFNDATGLWVYYGEGLTITFRYGTAASFSLSIPATVVFSDVVLSRTLSFAVKASASTTAHLYWNTFGLTIATKTLLFHVYTPVRSDRTLIFGTQAAAGLNTGLLWNTLSTLFEVSASDMLKWNTLANCVTDYSLLWNVQIGLMWSVVAIEMTLRKNTVAELESRKYNVVELGAKA